MEQQYMGNLGAYLASYGLDYLVLRVEHSLQEEIEQQQRQRPTNLDYSKWLLEFDSLELPEHTKGDGLDLLDSFIHCVVDELPHA